MIKKMRALNILVKPQIKLFVTRHVHVEPINRMTNTESSEKGLRGV